MRAILFAMPDTGPNYDLIARLPNLGIVSIAGYVKEHDILTVDLVVRRKKYKETVMRFVKKYKPDVVGISSMTFQYPTAERIAKIIKDYDSEIKLILGGYHGSLAYEEVSERGVFDYIIRGEGEKTFEEILDAFEGKKKLSEIRGLSYMKDGKFVHNEKRELLSLENLPIPDRKSRLIDGEFYIFNYNADTAETSRGCTHKCKFCSIYHMYGNIYREFKIERIMEDIGSVKALGKNAIVFSDDNITLKYERFEKLCDSIVEYGHNDIAYFTQASVITLGRDKNIIKKMKKAGFEGAFLGIESVSSRNLSFYRKGDIIKYTKRAIEFMKEEEMIVNGGFVLGAPDDKKEDIWMHYNFCVEMGIDIPVFQILTPYPGTKLREELDNMGMITNKDDYAKYTGGFANVRTKHMSSDELEFEVFKMYRKIYERKDCLWIVKKKYASFYRKLVFKTAPYFLKQKILKSLGIKSEVDVVKDDIKKDLEYILRD